MLDKDEGDVARQGAQNLDQLAPLARRELGGGFVEQDQPRRAGQREADLELALR